jgi:hypothetical protein
MLTKTRNDLKVSATVALILLFITAGACSHSVGNGSSTNKSASATSPSDARANPLDAMMKAFKAQLDLKAYRVRMETSGPGTGSQTRIAEYVAPDRFHMKGDKDEMIVIGPAAYMKAGDRWMKSPVDMSNMIASVRDPKFLDELRKSTDVSFVGPEVLEGTPALVYTYTMTNAFGTNMTTSSKSWVRASDGVPLRVESESTINGEKHRVVVTYYDFNADIKIEPPM